MRILAALTLIPFLLADTIENGLTDGPLVECGNEGLTIRFATQSVFEGHVYVKGHYGNRKCRTDASLVNSVNLTIAFADCDVLRQRSNNPKGILITSTVIITFHPMFITKVDKSYKVQCFYAEMEKSVTNQLDVREGKDMEKSVLVLVGDKQSEQSSNGAIYRAPHDGLLSEPAIEKTEINVPLPECRYQVLSESKTGEPVKFATVGQTVYHEWSCEDLNASNETKAASQSFCATVHSCNVREESGREVQLLDENGCAVDRFLLNNLEYTSDLKGGQISQVFKFADQSSLFFQCQIRLSVKENGVCVRSSDHCPAAIRGKRSTPSVDSKGDVDVVSQQMTVFDLDAAINPEAAKELAVPSIWTCGDVCMSPLAAGSLLSLLLSLLLVSIISVGLLCCRPRTVMAKLVR